VVHVKVFDAHPVQVTEAAETVVLKNALLQVEAIALDVHVSAPVPHAEQVPVDTK
jgi:hypothetical protein